MRISDWSSDVCSSDLVWFLSDLAYSELYYDGKPTPSILQVKGAKDIAVEFTSLSKTYSMAGWRMGFAVGNKHLIAAMARVKSYLDYGAFTPRSEEHTSELQSLMRHSYAVFCLKKKKQHKNQHNI